MKNLSIQQDWKSPPLILIMGKGGVGKTTLAWWCAKNLAKKTQGKLKKVLLAHVLLPGYVPLSEENPDFDEITLTPEECFSEYIRLKTGVKSLANILLGSKIVQTLQKAAPGIREIVMLGKVWHEMQNYDHVIVDMPSTGYSVSLLNAPDNFSKLFQHGPIHTDSVAMKKTLNDPAQTSLVCLTILEEMPVQESIELCQKLEKMFPQNPARLILNKRVFFSKEEEKLWNAHGKELKKLADTNPYAFSFSYHSAKMEFQGDYLQKLQRTGLNISEEFALGNLP